MSRNRQEGAAADSVTAVERPVASAGAGAGALPLGTVLAGRYEVRNPIGRGGMGLVVEAFDRTLGVSVAIKIVRAEYAGERQWSERLAREVKLARKIQHPNVCRVFDFAQAEGRAFLSMELASAGTLRSQVSGETAETRSFSERLADARAVAAGMAAIHAAGIVHRDLSPQNILRMADGRLVVSDFGLATDAFDGMTSIHGGTVAYMAPEVLAGGQASFASDVWALGAVIYEVVFGEPWRSSQSERQRPAGAFPRSLTRIERSVLEICRACTESDPARRPRGAGQIAAQLDDAALARMTRRRLRRRSAAVLAAAMVVLGGVVGARRIQATWKHTAQSRAMPADPLMIVPGGEPEDWTEKANVLAEVPDTIRCTASLPDQHTVRFVWGYPAHAEDVDTRTGEGRKPSPLVAEAYAEGCPDLSPDGSRLVYAGHTADNRAFAFVSAHADGRDGVPEIQTAEPSMDSDPIWLPEGDTFVYDVDDKHVGIFSVADKRSSVLPMSAPFASMSGHTVIGDDVFVTSSTPYGGSDVVGYDVPGLNERAHFRTAIAAWELRSDGHGGIVGVTFRDSLPVLLRIEPLGHRARFVGTISGRGLGHPLFVDGGLVFTSQAQVRRLIVRSPSGEVTTALPVSNDLMLASKCGDKMLATQLKGGVARTVWLAADGQVLGPVKGGEFTSIARCSADGRQIFWSRYGENRGLERCENDRCRTLVTGVVHRLALSTDDRRLAISSIDNRGLVVRWLAADGSGPVHEIANTETACAPLWANEKDLWVSFHEGREIVWREIDTDSGRPTGRTFPGSRECSNGRPDPSRPLLDPVDIEVSVRTELRLLPAAEIPGSPVPNHDRRAE